MLGREFQGWRHKAFVTDRRRPEGDGRQLTSRAQEEIDVYDGRTDEQTDGQTAHRESQKCVRDKRVPEADQAKNERNDWQEKMFLT